MKTSSGMARREKDPWTGRGGFTTLNKDQKVVWEPGLPAMVTARRQHNTRKATHDEDISCDLKATLKLSPDAKDEWVPKALQAIKQKKVKAQDVYDIVTHPRFVSGVGNRVGQSMLRSVMESILVFSEKQREAFNKSKLPHKFFMSTMTALVNELLVLPVFDSVLFDSPLNSEGYAQARILARVIETYTHPNAKERMASEMNPAVEQDMAALRGEPGSPSAVVVSSNLRRAAQTAVVALRSRLSGRFSYQTDPEAAEQVKVLPCLQEVSRNVDTLALAPPFTEISLPGIAEHIPDETALDLAHVLDVSDSSGNKPIFGTGLQRLQRFCEWSSERQEEMVIVAGHSLWFRHFFKTYLPKKVREELATQAKTLKMKNGGAVGFDLEFGLVQGGQVVFRIDPASIAIVHGGFDVKKKKKGLMDKLKGFIRKVSRGGDAPDPKKKAK